MKQLQYFIIGFLFVATAHISAQQTIKGILRDSVTKEAIEFANIGIPGKAVGTVSDEKGEFTLTIPDSLISFSLKTSMIGYRSKSFPVRSLLNGGTILMFPQNTKLSEVTVVSKKYKTKVLGHDTRTTFATAGFSKNSLGAEIAVPINIKHKNTQLKKFMLNISGNSLASPPVFRFNVYRVDKEGYPTQNILTENIVISPKEKVGFIEIDLKPYSLFVDEDVCISIEWIKDLGDVTGLFFSTKLIGNTTYFRQASQDKWEKTNVVGVGLHVEVGY